jgi:thiol:disulfide interchange protein DsbD
MLFVICGLSLIPGMFGTRLGDLEAYIPPPEGGGELNWIENDLNTAFAKAKTESKLVLVNFTGYACTNCHWMKANMFTRPEIAPVMKNLELVDLYTDGTDAASEANQKLEEDKFQTVAIPFYVLYDADRNVLATFPGLTHSSQEYLAFLNSKPAAPGSAINASAALGPTLDAVPFHKLDGAELSTSDWKGKVVVLNYWATWCIPCRAEIPEFNKIARELGPKGVEVVGISMDEDGAQSVKPFLKQIPMTYTVGLGTGALPQLPITVILDRNGRTVQRFEQFTSPKDIRAAIDKALTAS